MFPKMLKNKNILNILKQIRSNIYICLGLEFYFGKIQKVNSLIRLGTNYGGWNFIHSKGLYGATIISAGLGEDGSFDIEFATKYMAKIIIIDPTPRAINYYNKINKSLGNKNSQQYLQNGSEPVGAYDLSRVDENQLELVPKAIWNTNGKLKFFLPQNHDDISHSIVNFQNNYSSTTEYIYVETITFKSLVEQYKLSDIKLVKMDIEGAEVEVVIDMLDSGIFPEQILIEYDELAKPSANSRKRTSTVHNKLIDNGYILVNREGSNLTYASSIFLKVFE